MDVSDLSNPVVVAPTSALLMYLVTRLTKRSDAQDAAAAKKSNEDSKKASEEKAEREAEFKAELRQHMKMVVDKLTTIDTNQQLDKKDIHDLKAQQAEIERRVNRQTEAHAIALKEQGAAHQLALEKSQQNFRETTKLLLEPTLMAMHQLAESHIAQTQRTTGKKR